MDTSLIVQIFNAVMSILVALGVLKTHSTLSSLDKK